MSFTTFINQVVYSLSNVSSNKTAIKNRSIGAGTKDTSSRRSYKDTRGRGSKKFQVRNCEGTEFRRSQVICSKVYLKGKQCKSSIEEGRKAVRDLLLTYIFYNPSFWSLMFIIDTSFSDDILNQVMNNQYVIIDTTQCLLYRMCNT